MRYKFCKTVSLTIVLILLLASMSSCISKNSYREGEDGYTITVHPGRRPGRGAPRGAVGGRAVRLRARAQHGHGHHCRGPRQARPGPPQRPPGAHRPRPARGARGRRRRGGHRPGRAVDRKSVV